MKPALVLLSSALLSGCVVDYMFAGYDGITDRLDWLTGDEVGDGWDSNDCWRGWDPAVGVNIDEGCVTTWQTGSLETAIEWSMNTFGGWYPEFNATLMTPVVGHLTDDNGDGIIGLGDMPDIVVVNDRTEGQGDNGVFRIVSGDGTRVHVTVQGFEMEDKTTYTFNRYSNAAIGDVDMDGTPEVVVTVAWRGVAGGGDPTEETGGGIIIMPPDSGGGGESGESGDTAWHYHGPRPRNPDVGVPPPADGDTCFVAVLDPTGALEWVDDQQPLPCTGHSPAIADMEGDGDVEIILGNVIYNGADGSIQGVGTGRGRGYYPAIVQDGYQSFPLDLDLDGTMELVAGASLYRPDGSTLCEVDSSFEDGFPAAADLDGDGLGEFVNIGNGTARIYNPDCTLISTWKLQGTGCGGPPTIADFDGDGLPEVGTVNSNYYQVWNPEGTLVWAHEVSDYSSNTTGSSVFDFDVDGRAEVVYADETTLWVFDGATGTVRMAWTEHTSRTLHEYPVVVDVDADGLAEIVVPNGGGHYGYNLGGLAVLGGARRNWRTARQVWNQHPYNIVNINDDGSVPRYPATNWPTYNNFRAGTSLAGSGGLMPDPLPTEAALCFNKCLDGLIAIQLAIGNGGTSPFPAGLPVSAWALSGRERIWLETTWTSMPLEVGGTVPVFFQVPADLVPEGVVILVVNDGGGGGVSEECHTDNNEIQVEGVRCPAE